MIVSATEEELPFTLEFEIVRRVREASMLHLTSVSFANDRCFVLLLCIYIERELFIPILHCYAQQTAALACLVL